MDADSELSVDADAGVLSVTLDAFDRDLRPLDLLTVPITVYGPAGQPQDATLTQRGPGLYNATLPIEEDGSYVVVARPRSGTQRLTPLLAGATAPAGAELSRLSPDTGLLRQLAALTGGRLLSLAPGTAQPLFDRENLTPARTTRPIWPLLLAWTLAVFLIDVGTRRIAWDRLVSRKFGVDLRRELRDATALREAKAAEVLLSRRTQSRERDPDERAHALTEADAQQHRAEAKRRRLETHLSRQSSSHAAENPQRASHPAAPIEREANEADQGSPGDLLAAKRRATRRFEEDTP
jgi:hypothetical protein